jgi:cell division protein FtsW (lipid II flippase)
VHNQRHKPGTRSYVTLACMPAAATSATDDSRSGGGFRRMWRALKQLFYEMTGAAFAILALVWLNTAFRAWTRDTAHWLLAVVILVAAIFVFFAVSSFRRAKKI